jgi:serine protease Do
MKDYNETNENKENEQKTEMVDEGQLTSGTIEENAQLKDESCGTEESIEFTNERFSENETVQPTEENLNLEETSQPTDESINMEETSLSAYAGIKTEEAIIAPKITSKKHHNFKTYISLILVSSIISGSLVGGGLYLGFSNQLKKQNDAIERLSAISTIGNSSVATSAAVKKADYTGQSTVTKIAKEVGPSIVGIRMTVNSNQRSFYNSGMSEAEGSGIIISKDGYIMTNYHVVQYADPKASTSANTTLEVFLSDKTQAKAKFIGGDSETDLAVIKVDLNNLPVATLGDSSTLEVGELAVAIGNPLGMEFAGSVTTGVVSALNRTIQSADITQSLIQTDAAINPGNSGGALLDSNGEVIGINSAKISETGVEGLGFAIPINDAKPIINQLMMFGYVKGRPFIGISGQDVTDTISKTYNLPMGIYITQVSQGSGAAAAGIKTGDVLTAVNGKAVTTMDELNTVKKQYKPGDTVTITVVRNGKTLSIKLTFSEQR